MKLLKTINQNDFEPQDYVVRKTVRAIILNEDKTKILFFGIHFVGGGVEDGESDTEAIVREAMEEVGATVEIIEPIGEVVAYRDFLKKKYVVHGYLCKLVGELVTPTTTQSHEQGIRVEWVNIDDTVKRFQDQIDMLERETISPATDDAYQAKAHNQKTSLAILEEFIKRMV